MTSTGNPFPWPVGSATGIGSMPGTDVREAVKAVRDLLPVPFLPELPQRGVGADMIGRSAGLLVDLYAEVQPSGWRFVDRPGRDTRRAVSWLGQDLDVLEEFTQGYDGPLKIQVTGPWTLAATIELMYGDKALADPGACRDLADSLAEGVKAHVAEVRRRIPGAQLILQLDEPALPAVLAGAVPTASGFSRLRAIDIAVARERLRTVVDASGVPVAVHCCAADVPVRLLREAGAAAVSLDFSLLTGAGEEAFAEGVEAGTGFMLGVVPSMGATGTAGIGGLSEPTGSVKTLVDGVLTLGGRLGFRPAQLAEAVAVTPTCGLAGASPDYARTALKRSVAVARALEEESQG